jgi:hypothetical protein
MFTTTEDEPKSISEAIDSAEVKLWKDTMVEDMETLHKNETWDLVKLHSGRNHAGKKWVFKKKMNTVGQVEKFKARLVAKGYSLVEGVNFGEIFSHVVKLNSIRVLMYLVAKSDLEIEQIDVKTMFLHGDLKEEIYMKQPKGFLVKGMKDLVCKLKISPYGLKQSPRIWYQNFDTYILIFGFVRRKFDHYIYSKEEYGCFIYVSMYVDNMLLIGNNMDAIKEVNKKLSSKFDMKDLGVANFILGMEIKID